MMLSENAVKVLEGRYLLRNNEGGIVETPDELFRRVAGNVSEAESILGSGEKRLFEEKFYHAMRNLRFLPNSPTLMNAGKNLQQLAACFVLPVDDSLEKIFDAVKEAALIHKSGGGTGFSFSRLRPKNDPVKSTHGISSGPISFMEVFNSATEAIKQGGTRRGANMGILRVDHPDILDFIHLKETPGRMSNFNLSVAVTDAYMNAAKEGKDYKLINPKTGKSAGSLNAGKVLDLLAEKAWESGEPGIIFLDAINRANPTPQIGEIESTNPCGEQPLLPFESCTLGSLNLSAFVRNGEILWNDLAEVVFLAVRFLDDVIEVNNYPLKMIETMTKANRKIGLGVMGFADMLIHLGISYDSAEAVRIGEKVMAFIEREGHKASESLANERGPFPNYGMSTFSKAGKAKLRNATVTTVAPTGTISLIAGCSGGIEPLFGVAFKRIAMEGTELVYVHDEFVAAAKKKGFYSDELIVRIMKKGSVKDMEDIPREVRRLFVTAKDIDYRWHIKIQAAFQRYTDNAVSKTINFSENKSFDDVREAFLMAWELGCKGLTLYRYGSRKGQPLNICDYCKGRTDGQI